MTSDEDMTLTAQEKQQLIEFDSHSFGFLKLDSAENSSKRTLLEKGVHSYEALISKQAIQKSGEKEKIKELDPAIYCRLGHLLLLLEQYHKALSAYQKFYQLQEDYWKNAPFLYGLGIVYFHFNAYQLRLSMMYIVGPKLKWFCPDVQHGHHSSHLEDIVTTLPA